MDQVRKSFRGTNPKENANILSLLTFFYTFELFKKGRNKELSETDVYDIISTFKAQKLGDKLETQWIIEEARSKPSILRVLWKTYGKQYLLLGVIQLCMKLAVTLLLPEALGKLVSYFTPNSKITRKDVYYYAILVVTLNFINCIYVHNYILILTEMAIRIKTAFCSIIYRKSLKLNPLSGINTGQIVTLMTKDVQSFDSAVFFTNDIWIGLVQTMLVTLMLYLKIGLAAFAGIGFFLLVIPLQIYIGKTATLLRVKASKITDKRLQSTQETLSAIKVIKMYTWEKVFEREISKARQLEMNKIKTIYYIKVVTLLIGGLVSQISFYLLMMTYVYLNHNITAETVFFVMGCFHSLRSTITISIPMGISQLAELAASIGRISSLLVAKELKLPKRLQNPEIILKHVTVNLNDNKILEDITLKINSGLNLITGPIGSGKSALLKTILEDYPISEGVLNVGGRISYASEEPWLFPSTIKQNILFGQSYSQERYHKVLEVCALNSDINMMKLGDSTLVSDKALNLSKGQQARINLARAIYNKADIYLLDDCLSTLDAHLQEFVFRECIKKFLKDKICLLVSHNNNHLKQANNVVILEKGRLKLFSKSSEVLFNQFEFIDGSKDELVEELEEEEEQEEDSVLLKKDETIHNIYFEDKKNGKVNWGIYEKYCRFGGGAFTISNLIILFVVSQISVSYTDKLVSNWVNIEQNISDFKMRQMTNSSEYEEIMKKHSNILKTYSILIVISTILVLGRAFAHFYFSAKASLFLHKSMIFNIINVELRFFDTHFIGNILNRFSKDLGTIDEYLPLVTYECLRVICVLIGVTILIATVNLLFLLLALVFFILLYYMRQLYMPTGRSLKRLDSATRSPVIGYLNATLDGLTTIRAFQIENILQKQFDKHQDFYTSTTHMFQCTSRAFGFYLDIVCCLFITIIVFRFILLDSNVEAGNVGLAITQAFILTGLLQWGIRQWAELENQMTSVERVLEYTDCKKENRNGLVLPDWPKIGSICFRNVCLSYNKEQVLRNLCFNISGGEKIGIVGRTGAGKSSIIAALFRLYDSEGKITIDSIDIKTLKLDYLRSGIAIIPQNPVLFTGTIRHNVDPSGMFTDKQIWKALEIVNLNGLIGNLDFNISENGSNFSLGQKQLICLARAAMSKSKLVVLDEATANMDSETEDVIYKTIKENFKNCTVLTIVHRLTSVLNSDRIMVVDKGEIVEFDKPEILLKHKNVFYRMIKQAGLLNH